jgi:hypothetical protein
VASGAQLRRLDVERRLLAEDRGLELAQIDARLEPELLQQCLASAAKGLERVGLAP